MCIRDRSYSGIAPRSTCRDWVLHFSGPSGSGKSFLAEIVASAAFDTWVEEPYPAAEYGLAGSRSEHRGTRVARETCSA